MPLICHTRICSKCNFVLIKNTMVISNSRGLQGYPAVPKILWEPLLWQNCTTASASASKASSWARNPGAASGLWSISKVGTFPYETTLTPAECCFIRCFIKWRFILGFSVYDSSQTLKDLLKISRCCPATSHGEAISLTYIQECWKVQQRTHECFHNGINNIRL